MADVKRVRIIKRNQSEQLRSRYSDGPDARQAWQPRDKGRGLELVCASTRARAEEFRSNYSTLLKELGSRRLFRAARSGNGPLTGRAGAGAFKALPRTVGEREHRDVRNNSDSGFVLAFGVALTITSDIRPRGVARG